MTLRARLTVALVALLAAGLIAADVATYSALRAFLVRRVDQQLTSAQVPAILMLRDSLPSGDTTIGPPGGDTGLPYGTYAAAYGGDGQLIVEKFATFGGVAPANPSLPSSISLAPGGRFGPQTVGSVGGGLRYRVIATALPSGGTLVVAIPLSELTATLRRLVAITLVVTVAVLAAMAGLSWWMVRRGLRPLEQIEQTAGSIAAGDLSRRVEDTDPRTEVGRLGGALNVMLGRIEGAMDERRASEEALRRFLADASHELRTPLTSIRGYAELFRRGAADDPADAALAMRRIEQESDRMGTLVNDLLFLARAGEGRPISHDRVDLTGIVADAVADARVVEPSRPIDLQVPAGLVVAGDEGRLRQVIANLLMNALTHTPEDTLVTVRLRENGEHAELEVSDSGEGLTPEDAAHVFEPFYRTDASRARVRVHDGWTAEGSGLGLAIVAAIAEAHGGNASVISEEGGGATFLVRLPVADDSPSHRTID